MINLFQNQITSRMHVVCILMCIIIKTQIFASRHIKSTLIRPRLESLRFSKLQMLNLILGRSSRCDNWRWKLWCLIGTMGKVVWRNTWRSINIQITGKFYKKKENAFDSANNTFLFSFCSWTYSWVIGSDWRSGREWLMRIAFCWVWSVSVFSTFSCRVMLISHRQVEEHWKLTAARRTRPTKATPAPIRSW